MTKTFFDDFLWSTLEKLLHCIASFTITVEIGIRVSHLLDFEFYGVVVNSFMSILRCEIKRLYAHY